MTIDKHTEVDHPTMHDTALAMARSIRAAGADLVRSIPLSLVPLAIALLLSMRPSDQQWRDWAADVAVSPNNFLEGVSSAVLTLLVAYTGLNFLRSGVRKKPESSPPAGQGRVVLSAATTEGR